MPTASPRVLVTSVTSLWRRLIGPDQHPVADLVHQLQLYQAVGDAATQHNQVRVVEVQQVDQALPERAEAASIQNAYRQAIALGRRLEHGLRCRGTPVSRGVGSMDSARKAVPAFLSQAVARDSGDGGAGGESLQTAGAAALTRRGLRPGVDNLMSHLSGQAVSAQEGLAPVHHTAADAGADSHVNQGGRRVPPDRWPVCRPRNGTHPGLPEWRHCRRKPDSPTPVPTGLSVKHHSKWAGWEGRTGCRFPHPPDRPRPPRYRQYFYPAPSRFLAGAARSRFG